MPGPNFPGSRDGHAYPVLQVGSVLGLRGRTPKEVTEVLLSALKVKVFCRAASAFRDANPFLQPLHIDLTRFRLATTVS